MEHNFFLKSNQFLHSVSEGFGDLLAKDSLVDVSLGVEGKLLNAHKLVLSLSSPYLKLMFETVRHPHPIIILKDVTVKQLSHVLNFMYHGEVNIPQSDMPGFLKTVELLQVRGLSDIGDSTVVTEQGPSNWITKGDGNKGDKSILSEVPAKNKRPCTSLGILKDQKKENKLDSGQNKKRNRASSESASSTTDTPILQSPKKERLEVGSSSEEVREHEEEVTVEHQAGSSGIVDVAQPRGDTQGDGSEVNLALKYRGQMQLQLDGYTFQVDRRSGIRVFWRCARYRAGCRARCVTTHYNNVRLTQPTHNHPPPHGHSPLSHHDSPLTHRYSPLQGHAPPPDSQLPTNEQPPQQGPPPPHGPQPTDSNSPLHSHPPPCGLSPPEGHLSPHSHPLPHGRPPSPGHQPSRFHPLPYSHSLTHSHSSVHSNSTLHGRSSLHSQSLMQNRPPPLGHPPRLGHPPPLGRVQPLGHMPALRHPPPLSQPPQLGHPPQHSHLSPHGDMLPVGYPPRLGHPSALGHTSAPVHSSLRDHLPPHRRSLRY